MPQFDIVQIWIDNVAASHSRSRSTAYNYPRCLRMFCEFAGTSPEQIIEDYQSKEYDERRFKAKYRQYLQAWISSFSNANLTPATVADRVKAVKSFFKYNDMPIGFMPASKRRGVFNNRDIEKEEIQAVIGGSEARERAFFAFMTQSGLRPETICKLQFEDLEPLDKIPCKITVNIDKTKGEYNGYFTFIGDDTIKYLKEYLANRKKKGPKDYVFMNKRETIPYDRTYPSRYFKGAAQKLREAGSLEYKTKVQGKPSELRLYNLRKYFRRMATNAGSDFTNFWMGHSLPQSSDKHYFPGKGEGSPSKQVVEEHRQKYSEKAMPFLRLETATPTETEKTIEELRQQLAHTREERDTFEARLDRIEKYLEEHMAKQEKQLKEIGWKPQGSS